MKIVETPGREQPFAVWDNKGMLYFFAKTRTAAERYIRIREGANHEVLDATEDYLRGIGR
jgi:hypothetical protein